MLLVHLDFVLGDDFATDEFAVLIDDEPVILDPAAGWSVRAQARARRDDAGPAAIEWTTGNGRIRVGSATLAVDSTAVTTSTVQLRHGPESETWLPLVGEYECEITRTVGGQILANRTILGGRVVARRGVSRP